MSNENGSGINQIECARKFFCERYRRYSKTSATIREHDGQKLNPLPQECLGKLAKGKTCARYLGPSSDEDEQFLSAEPRYFLDD